MEKREKKRTVVVASALPSSPVADTAAISFSLLSSLLLFLFAAVEGRKIEGGSEAAVGRSVGTGGSLVKITSSCVMCLSLPPFLTAAAEAARRGEERGMLPLDWGVMEGTG